jgi:hypothetical protein
VKIVYLSRLLTSERYTSLMGFEALKSIKSSILPETWHIIMLTKINVVLDACTSSHVSYRRNNRKIKLNIVPAASGHICIAQPEIS